MSETPHPVPRRPRARRLVLALGLGLLGLCLALAASFLLRPFWYFERLGKLALQAAGLERAELAGPRGRLAYWHGGSGPTALLLHGANDQAGAWSLVAKPLAARHRLVVPDLPGHGESEPREGPLSVTDLAAGVDQLVAAESARGPVTLVGNSLGGWLALLAAFRAPERVHHVVLVNGAAIRAEPGAAINLLPSTRDEARQAVEALTAPGSPAVPAFVLDDIVRRAPGSPMARMMQAPVDEALFVDGRLGELSVPVTLLWGDADRLMPPSYAENVRGRLRAARLEIVKHCGHVPQRECPDRLLPLLERALSAPPEPGS